MSRKVMLFVLVLAVSFFIDTRIMAGEFAPNLIEEMNLSSQNYFKLKEELLQKVDHSSGNVENATTNILSVPTSNGVDIVLSFTSPQSGDAAEAIYYKQETYNGGMVKLTIYAIPQKNVAGYTYLLGSDLK